jgi:hypothetical protein
VTKSQELFSADCPEEAPAIENQGDFQKENSAKTYTSGGDSADQRDMLRPGSIHRPRPEVQRRLFLSYA